MRRANLLETIESLEDDLDVDSGITDNRKYASMIQRLVRKSASHRKWATEDIADLDDALDALEEEFNIQ